MQKDVHAPVRVITTNKNKEFASNVAVNLNNQTRVDNTFLRSNDPRIVQLLHSLAPLGYYLERRAGEIDAMLPDEVKNLEAKFGAPLVNRVIPLKDGMQAYVATYYCDPQLAKKDSAKIFTDDGGSFSKILQSGLTAEKIRDAYELSRLVSAQVDLFKKIKRKRYVDDIERKNAYVQKFGSFVGDVFDDLDTAIPQITAFGMAAIYEKHCNVCGLALSEVVRSLAANPSKIWECFVELVQCRRIYPNAKSWPTLLKSGAFYKDAIKHLRPDWKEQVVPGKR